VERCGLDRVTDGLKTTGDVLWHTKQSFYLTNNDE